MLARRRGRARAAGGWWREDGRERRVGSGPQQTPQVVDDSAPYAVATTVHAPPALPGASVWATQLFHRSRGGAVQRGSKADPIEPPASCCHESSGENPRNGEHTEARPPQSVFALALLCVEPCAEPDHLSHLRRDACIGNPGQAFACRPIFFEPSCGIQATMKSNGPNAAMLERHHLAAAYLHATTVSALQYTGHRLDIAMHAQ